VLVIICARRLQLKPHYVAEYDPIDSNFANDMLLEIFPHVPMTEITLELVQSVFKDFSIDFERN
jgi:hypothetical protein